LREPLPLWTSHSRNAEKSGKLLWRMMKKGLEIVVLSEMPPLPSHPVLPGSTA